MKILSQNQKKVKTKHPTQNQYFSAQLQQKKYSSLTNRKTLVRYNSMSAATRKQKSRLNQKRNEWWLCYRFLLINFNPVFNLSGCDPIYNQITRAHNRATLAHNRSSELKRKVRRESVRKSVAQLRARRKVNNAFCLFLCLKKEVCNQDFNQKVVTLLSHAKIVFILNIFNKITHAKPRTRRVPIADKRVVFFEKKSFFEAKEALGAKKTISWKCPENAILHRRVYRAAKGFVSLYMRNRRLKSRYGLEIKMRQVFMNNIELLKQQEEVQAQIFEEIQRKEEQRKTAQVSLDISNKFEDLVKKIEDELEINPEFSEISVLQKYRIARETAEREFYPERFDSGLESEYRDWDVVDFFSKLPDYLRVPIKEQAYQQFKKNQPFRIQNYYLSSDDRQNKMLRFELIGVIREMDLIEKFRHEIKMKAPKEESNVCV